MQASVAEPLMPGSSTPRPPAPAAHAHPPCLIRPPLPAGEWTLGRAPELKWSEGDNWHVTVQLPAGAAQSQSSRASSVLVGQGA